MLTSLGDRFRIYIYEKEKATCIETVQAPGCSLYLPIGFTQSILGVKIPFLISRIKTCFIFKIFFSLLLYNQRNF